MREKLCDTIGSYLLNIAYLYFCTRSVFFHHSLYWIQNSAWRTEVGKIKKKKMNTIYSNTFQGAIAFWSFSKFIWFRCLIFRLWRYTNNSKRHQVLEMLTKQISMKYLVERVRMFLNQKNEYFSVMELFCDKYLIL